VQGDSVRLASGDDLPQDLVQAVLDACPHLPGGSFGQAVVRTTLASMSIAPDNKHQVLTDRRLSAAQFASLLDLFTKEVQEFQAQPIEAYLGMNALSLVEAVVVAHGITKPASTLLEAFQVARSIVVNARQGALLARVLDLPRDAWQEQSCGCLYAVYLNPSLEAESDGRDLEAWLTACLLVDRVRWRGEGGLLEGGRSSGLHRALSAVKVQELSSANRPTNDWARAWAWLAERKAGSDELDAAAELYGRALQEYEDLIEHQGRKKLRHERARNRAKLGHVYSRRGELDAAIDLLGQALQEFEDLIERQGRKELRHERAHSRTMLGYACSRRGELDAAIDLFGEALQEFEDLIEREGRKELRNSRAFNRANLANVRSKRGELDAAIDLFSQALQELEGLIEHEGRKELRHERARIRANLANIRTQRGELDAAIDLFREALQELEDLIERERRKELRESRAYYRANLAEVHSDRGELDAAINLLGQALQELEDLIEREGRKELRHERTRIRANLANIRTQRGELDAAIDLFSQALHEYEDLIERQGRKELRHERARLRGNLGYARSRRGELDAAIDLFGQALQEFEDLIEREGRKELRHERARLRANLGHALSKREDLDAAIDLYGQALQEFEDLIEREGRKELRNSRAFNRANLANVRSKRGELDAAIDLFGQALQELEDLIEREGRKELRHERARLRGNLGYARSSRGEGDAAIDLYSLALQEYEDLIEHEGRKDLRDSRARLRDNLGHARSKRGELDAAIDLFGQALQEFEDLIERQGRKELRHDRAINRVVLANVRSKRGDSDAAIDLYGHALQEFEDLIEREGRKELRHERAINRAKLATAHAQAEEWAAAFGYFVPSLFELRTLAMDEQRRQHAPSYFGAAAMTFAQLSSVTCAATLPAGDAAVWQLLADALAQGELLASDWHKVQVLDEFLSGLASWINRSKELQHPVLTDLLRQATALQLRWLADLLSDAGAEFLSANAARIEQLIDQARQAVLCWQDPLELANWYFHTQGLHAQRLALIASDEPEVQELVALIHQLRQVEEQLWGPDGGRTGVSDNSSRSVGDAGRSAALPSGTQIQADRRIAQAREHRMAELLQQSRALRLQRDAKRQALVDRGLLPANISLRLDARALRDQIPTGHGVLMLARGGDDQPLAVSLFTDCFGAVQSQMLLSDANSYPQAPVHNWRHAVRAADHWINSGRVARGAALREGAAAPEDAPPTLTEQEIGQAQEALSRWLQPLLLRLQAKGVQELSLVASDDLNLLPWWRLLRGYGLRVRVWPTAGDWYRRTIAECGVVQPTLALPRWAQVHHDARDEDGHAIVWVAMEAALSRRLWGQDATGQPLMHDDLLQREELRWPDSMPVQALLAAGHGRERGQGHSAGVLVGRRHDGQGIVLTGHHFTQIRNAERLLLSACVLGRLDDAMGEPLGAAATAFGYRARFAVGSLIRVGDMEAMVFSLALQWALKAAIIESSAQQKPEPDWAEVFQQLQQALHEGYYPQGFGDWLAQEMPLAAQTAVPNGQQADSEPELQAYRAAWRRALREELDELGHAAPGVTDWQPAWRCLANAWAQQPRSSLQRTANWMVCLGR
jgi:tetratricopeptide (TPR) repeat protein